MTCFQKLEVLQNEKHYVSENVDKYNNIVDIVQFQGSDDNVYHYFPKTWELKLLADATQTEVSDAFDEDQPWTAAEYGLYVETTEKCCAHVHRDKVVRFRNAREE